MKRIPVAATLLLVLLCCAAVLQAETYHVSLSGSDTNSGSVDFPWRTIQKAADTMLAGDTAIVHSGNFGERVTTVRGGTSETNRLIFKAEGVSTMQGFAIYHPFVTVDGFDITQHSASGRFTAYIEIESNGDSARILNNTIRDAIAISRMDLVFSDNFPAPDTISSATGGFLAAGFRPDITIRILRPDRTSTLLNSSVQVVVGSVTDNQLMLADGQNILSEGPVSAFISGANNYALFVDDGAGQVIVRSNRFSNLGFDMVWAGGENNLYESNVFEQGNGFNIIVYSGQNHHFVRNWIHSSLPAVYVPSPDAMENWSQLTANNMVFEENYVENFGGPLGVHHLQVLGSNSNLLFRRNVFVNAGPFVVGFPNTSFINNTFYSIAASDTGVSTPELHPILFQNSPGRFSGEGAILKNNIFVACGYDPRNPELSGWYDVSEVTDYVADFNFVAGDSPDFAAKTGFGEGRPALNGGDPGFVDIVDPLGPDGLPFTEDDGLRLQPDSKLLGAGEGGADLGAYAMPMVAAVLHTNGLIRITWPSVGSSYTLQSASAVTSAWQNVTAPQTSENGVTFITVDNTNQTTFFRLTR